MRYDHVYFGSLGVRLGAPVRTPAAVRRGFLSIATARRTQQRSVCVATESAAELAAVAARSALHRYDDLTGRHTELGLHLHATMDTAPTHPFSRSGPGRGIGGRWVPACDINTTTTADGPSVIERAASLQEAHASGLATLVSAGSQFGRPQWIRYSIDDDALYGDAGAAVLLTSDSGFARLLSTVTITDTSLAGYIRGIAPSTVADHDDATAVDHAAHRAAWLAANGGMPESLRRCGAGVTQAVKNCLADADLDLDQMSWILTPFLGAQAVREQWLEPLGIDDTSTLTALGLHLGHLGPADQLVALDHLARTDQLATGDHVLLAGSGAGMTWSAAVLRIESTPSVIAGTQGGQARRSRYSVEDDVHYGDAGAAVLLTRNGVSRGWCPPRASQTLTWPAASVASIQTLPPKHEDTKPFDPAARRAAAIAAACGENCTDRAHTVTATHRRTTHATQRPDAAANQVFRDSAHWLGRKPCHSPPIIDCRSNSEPSNPTSSGPCAGHPPRRPE